jgi:hypothetical protein
MAALSIVQPKPAGPQTAPGSPRRERAQVSRSAVPGRFPEADMLAQEAGGEDGWKPVDPLSKSEC